MTIESAYVHVPFCDAICKYCAFARTANGRLKDAWLDQLLRQAKQELSLQKSSHPDAALSTLYFGGGTPGSLAGAQLQTLCAFFSGWLAEDYEWTVELNPEGVTPEKARILKKAGVNRISMGAQSFDEQTLRRLGRRHDAGKIKEAMQILRNEGFENISLDLIIACPWQTIDDVRKDLAALIALQPEHCSVYTLILEEDSVFGKQHLQPADEDFEEAAYETAVQMLKEAGYDHYEISSYAKDGKVSRHNLAYWNDAPYFGFGYGAAGRDENGLLYHHEGSLEDFCQSGFQKVLDEDQDPAFNALLMGLRTRFGVNIGQWNRRYGKDLEKRYAPVWKKYEEVLERKEGALILSEKGREILDSLLLDLMMAD